MAKIPPKEAYNFYNSLIGLVRMLEKQHTIIDLRDESSVSGLIHKVDGYMNIEMKNVVFYDSRGCEHKFTDFYVKKRNIRYVHIPENLSIKELFENQLDGLSRPSELRKQKPQRTNKQQRTKRYHESIVREAYNQPGPSNS